MPRKKTWLFVSVVVALVLSGTGVALAQQQAEPPDPRQQQAQQDAERGAMLDREEVIDSGVEINAAHSDD